MGMDVTGIMSENVIIADASYLDKVAFDLTVNFERMLERRIQKADLCRWLDCVALDGGIEPGDNKIQVIFIYDGNGGQLDNFNPSNLEKDINGMAFKDNLGEFMMAAYPVAKDVTDMGRFFVETLKVTGDCKETNNIMVVADIEKYGNEVKEALGKIKHKEKTLFAMEPQTGSGFCQEILGYSLMNALGIRGDELK